MNGRLPLVRMHGRAMGGESNKQAALSLDRAKKPSGCVKAPL